MKITGTILPLKDKVFVSDMEFGAQKTAGGLYIPSANGKAEGISPRWGRVWAVGPEQEDVTKVKGYRAQQEGFGIGLGLGHVVEGG